MLLAFSSALLLAAASCFQIPLYIPFRRWGASVCFVYLSVGFMAVAAFPPAPAQVQRLRRSFYLSVWGCSVPEAVSWGCVYVRPTFFVVCIISRSSWRSTCSLFTGDGRSMWRTAIHCLAAPLAPSFPLGSSKGSGACACISCAGRPGSSCPSRTAIINGPWPLLWGTCSLS